MTSTYVSPRRVLLRFDADLRSKTTRTLEPLLSLSPGAKVRVACGSSHAARLVEEHEFVGIARARGVKVDVRIADERRARAVDGLAAGRIIVDENLDMPLAEPIDVLNRMLREQEAPWLPIWRRNDPGA